MRILVIIDTYVPARISGALQMHDLAKEMLAQGHHPTVLVPAYGLGRPWVLEKVDGVEVLRVNAPRTKDVWHLRRVLAELFLPFALLSGLACSPFSSVAWEGVVWYSPSIFLGPIVHWLKRRHGCPTYLILRDLFPDWAVDAGVMRRGLAYRFFKQVERYQYRIADRIGVQTSANIPLVARDCKKDPARIEVLNNWLSEPPRTAVASIDLSKGRLAGKTIFVYAGNMGAAQGMDCLINLAIGLRHRDDIGFLFVGRGSDVPRLRSLAKEADLINVIFLDEVDSGEIPGILSQCHIGLIALDPRHTTHNIPGKFLTYLQAGLPVLARINPGNDLESLIQREGVGRVCAGEMPERFQLHAEEMVADDAMRATMGRLGRALVSRDFSSSAAVGQVIQGLRLCSSERSRFAES